MSHDAGATQIIHYYLGTVGHLRTGPLRSAEAVTRRTLHHPLLSLQRGDTTYHNSPNLCYYLLVFMVHVMWGKLQGLVAEMTRRAAVE